MQPQHRVGHLKQLLATDPRTNLLDVELRVVDRRVFIAGSVESAVLAAAAEQVIREALPPEMEVVNNLCVEAFVP